tara:strand:- start:1224 stop:1451 length:228 start_codon:yes stop_codon:yes gene_type:complete
MEKSELREIIKTQIEENQLYDAHPITMLELRESLVEALHQALDTSSVSGSFSEWYSNGFKDGLAHRTLKCKCGKN